MLSSRGVLVVVLCAGSLSAVVAARVSRGQEPAKATGEMRILVRGPDGRAVADTTVNVETEWGGHPKVAPISAKTNAQGELTIIRPAGVDTVRLLIPGVGYGATGLTYVAPGKQVRAFLPPLAPWATIRGKVPSDLLKTDTRVEVGSPYQQVEDSVVVPRNDGTFQIEVPTGEYYLSINAKEGAHRTVVEMPNGVQWIGEEKQRLAHKWVPHVFPGQILDFGLMDKVSPPPKQSKAEAAPAKQTKQQHREESAIVRVAGIVRDTAGKPIAGRDGFGFCDVQRLAPFVSMAELKRPLPTATAAIR